MWQLITNVPIFVWPLFLILLIGGLKARKPSTVPLKMLLIFPTALSMWLFLSFAKTYENDHLALFLWVLCVGIGSSLGSFHMGRTKLRFDKEKKRVELPGSWVPLILSMSIFAARFSIAMMRSTLPHLEGSTFLLNLELFSGIILGAFIGRGLHCLQRYKTSDVVK